MPWVIGDIQGCFHEFQGVLSHPSVDFEEGILLLGDTVNRGPDSISTVRWIMTNRERVRMILGNHELGLLRAYHSQSSSPHSDHQWFWSLEQIERDRIAEFWHRSPLIAIEDDWLAVHAGFNPKWDESELRERAERVHQALHSSPDTVFWGDDLQSQSLREDLQWLTRVRWVQENGEANWTYKGPPENSGPGGLQPWYTRAEHFQSKAVYFGHWAAHRAKQWKNFTCVDDGCVWGNSLVAIHHPSSRVVRVPHGDNIPSTGSL